ncbi:MAG: hypothetical protein CVV34_07000, partial [Methanomicrobiales archaeon HGW-Methanomicrobiales-5]
DDDQIAEDGKSGIIPDGAVIHHSDMGVTTVFDSEGKQLFAANDADAGMVFTPTGYKPATFVNEIPNGSFVDVKGSTIYVSYNGKLILTILDDHKNKGTTAKSGTLTYNPTWREEYIEGAQSAVLSNIGQFTANWNVPASPSSLYVDPSNPTRRSQLAIWNGITTNDESYLVQPVLEWAWKDRASSPEPGQVWTGASWFVYPGSSSTLHSTRISGIYSGDNIEGNMLFNYFNNYWTITFRDTTRNIQTTYMTSQNAMPNTNVKIQIYLETANRDSIPNNNYMCGDSTFTNFYLVNTNGQNVMPGTVGSGVNSVWTNLPGMSVGNSWPTRIILNTAN